MTLIKSLIFSKKEIEMSPARRKKKDVRVMLERLEPGPAGSNSSSVSAPKCLLTQCRSSGTWLWPHRGRMERGWEGEEKAGVWLRTDLFEGDSHRDLDKSVQTRERNPRWSQTGRRRDPDLLWLPAGSQHPPRPPHQSCSNPSSSSCFSSHAFGKPGLGVFPIVLFFSFHRKRSWGLRHWIPCIWVREHRPTYRGDPGLPPPIQDALFLRGDSSACPTHFRFRQSLLLSPIQSKEQPLPLHALPLPSRERMRY